MGAQSAELKRSLAEQDVEKISWQETTKVQRLSWEKTRDVERQSWEYERENIYTKQRQLQVFFSACLCLCPQVEFTTANMQIDSLSPQKKSESKSNSCFHDF